MSLNFRGDLQPAVAYRNKQAVYVDRIGRTQIRGPFLEATAFVHGLAAVLLTEKQAAYIDRNGKRVFAYVRR